MHQVRAVTLIAENPSDAATALAAALAWEVESDVGSFASAVPRDEEEGDGSAHVCGVPIWINAPSQDQPPTTGLYLHFSTVDVDASHRRAVSHGAHSTREPQDMDFGERSAQVVLDALPGVTLDFAVPLQG